MKTDLKDIADLGTLSPEDINELAKYKGQEFAKNIKTNQIRNVYGAISRIRNEFNKNSNEFNEKIKRDLVMLKPKLAYAAGKNKSVKPFQDLFDDAITTVVNSKQPQIALQNFLFLSEAVVAYHKFFGGKEN